ncbi:MAG: hypothetical protein GYA57_04170 [Myxococcales bacterium]|nr:hypothetical protein [Myxococcales bacterium]
MRTVCCLPVLLALFGCYDSWVNLAGDGGSPDDARADVAADADAEADADADAEADVTPSCPPPGDGVWADFTVDGSTEDEADLDLPCVVDSVIAESGGGIRINLGCGTGAILEPHTIELLASPGPWLFGLDGLEVRFRYVAERVWWINRWFSLRDASGYVQVFGVSAENLAPPGSTPNEWYAPANIDLRTGVCPPTTESCGRIERLALQVAYSGETRLVFDGTADSVGEMLSLYVIVAGATRYLEMTCTDMPRQFVTALLFGLLEG